MTEVLEAVQGRMTSALVSRASYAPQVHLIFFLLCVITCIDQPTNIIILLEYRYIFLGC